MEASTFHEIWLNLATNSPFLAFLVWNWWRNTQMLESYRLEMKKDREDYEEKREIGIEKIRERYAQVIDSVKAERENYRLEMERIREKCEQDKNQILAEMSRKIDKINENMR